MINVGWEQKVYPATKVAAVADALRAEGALLAEALKGTHISATELYSPTMRVSVNQVIQVIRNAARQSKDPHFAYHTGLKTHVSLYGMYGFAILSSMNFRETMRFAEKYHLLATPLVRLRFNENSACAIWDIDPLPHPSLDARLYRFIVEMQFGVLGSLHRDVMGSAFGPSELHVTFDPPGDEKKYAEALGCHVLFTQAENRFVFDPAWLNGIPQFGNEITSATVLHQCSGLLEELAHRVGFAGKVREILLATIGRRASFNDVARRLDMPVRTLHRKLREQDTSFRDIMDQLRHELAVKYLRDTGMTIGDIAHALGFSDAANFRHAFRRWSKLSPQAFRRAAGAKIQD